MRSDLDDVVTEMRMAGMKQEKLLESILAKITPNSAQSNLKEEKRTAAPRSESPPLDIPPNLIVNDKTYNCQDLPCPGAAAIGGQNTSIPVPVVYCTQSQGNLHMGTGLARIRADVHAHQGSATGQEVELDNRIPESEAQELDPDYAFDPDLVDLPLRGESGNKMDIKVVQFNGIPENYKKWKQQMVAYLVQHGTQKCNDYVLRNFLDSKLKPKSAPEKVIKSEREARKARGKLALNFSQEMELICKWFTPNRDNTCMNTKMTAIQWDRKKETIGQLVTDVMWTLTHNHPTLESTPFRVNELITKLAVKNFAPGRSLAYLAATR